MPVSGVFIAYTAINFIANRILNIFRQPRPTKGILVAITVWYSTLALRGKFAM